MHKAQARWCRHGAGGCSGNGVDATRIDQSIVRRGPERLPGHVVGTANVTLRSSSGYVLLQLVKSEEPAGQAPETVVGQGDHHNGPGLGRTLSRPKPMIVVHNR
jgi:hypothetical protein